MMNQDEKQDEAVNEDQQPTAELSPSEKLEDVTPTGSLVPGAQNPVGVEVSFGVIKNS